MSHSERSALDARVADLDIVRDLLRLRLTVRKEVHRAAERRLKAAQASLRDRLEVTDSGLLYVSDGTSPLPDKLLSDPRSLFDERLR